MSRVSLFQKRTFEISVSSSFEELEVVWRTLEQVGHCSAFQTFEWQIAWQRTVGQAEGIVPYIVVLSTTDRGPVMLIPLGISKEFGVRSLRFLSEGAYNVPLVCASFAQELAGLQFPTIWAEILKRLPPVDIIRLRSLPEELDGIPNPFMQLPNLLRQNPTFACRLSKSFADLVAEKSGSTRRSLNRRRRVLQSFGAVNYLQTKARADWTTFLSEILRQREVIFKETGRPNNLRRDDWQAFHWQLTEAGIRSGFVHLSALKVDDTIISLHWGVLFKGRLYSLLLTYNRDSRWARCSPGRMLLEHVIEWACEQNLGSLDLGPGEFPYKNTWCDVAIKRYEHVSSRTVIGALPLAGLACRRRLRRYVTSSPRLHRILNWLKKMRVRT
jgi:CelD/BcsL family acetyltransferase involved in cellulose biosynthesis